MKPKSSFTPSPNHWTVNNYTERCLRANFRDLLLKDELLFRNGTACKWKGKAIGAGVYEIWLEEWKE